MSINISSLELRLKDLAAIELKKKIDKIAVRRFAPFRLLRYGILIRRVRRFMGK